MPSGCGAWLVADGRSVVAEFTIYGQSQAAREPRSLPCLCDRGERSRGASLSPASFIQSSGTTSKTPARKMPHELSESGLFPFNDGG